MGHKMRIEIIILCLILGAFIGVNVFCSCSGGIMEGFKLAKGIGGAALDYSMGVDKNFSNNVDESYNYNSWYSNLEMNSQGRNVPLPEGQLDLFAENVSSPDCCPSTYTTSTGCLCETPEQAQYLNQRGGNRTLNSNY